MPLPPQRLAFILGSCAALAVAASAWYTLAHAEGGIRRVSREGHTPSHTHDPGTTTPRNLAAAELAYPAASLGEDPRLKTTYDAGHDRTRMVLTLSGLPGTLAPAATLRDVSLRLTSEFAGTRRMPGHGELSVLVAVEVHSSTNGALSMGSDTPFVEADGAPLSTRPPASAAHVHQTVRTSGLWKETVMCRLDTDKLLSLARASKAAVHVGRARIELPPDALAAVREFAARMNPGA